MDLAALNESPYMAKGDVPAQGLNLTIAKFDFVTMRDKEQKLAIYWMEAHVKPMICNKTNRNRLQSIFGTGQSQAMIGQKVNVHNDVGVEMAGEIVGGLRIRPCALSSAPTPAQVAGPDPAVSGAALAAALKLLQSRADAAQKIQVPDDEIPF